MNVIFMPQDETATVSDDHARAEECQQPREQHTPENSLGEAEKQDLEGQAMQEKKQLREACRGHIHTLTIHGFR